MFVKLDPDITDDRKNYIANGIRGFFRDDTTILFDLKVTLKSIESSVFLFQIFVAFVGTISLILAFFLLLVSTTQNIRESLWEYGCLRAMGLSKAQGVRMYMYEQYSLILASLTIGTAVGLALASIIAAQFFLFLEQPFALQFPSELTYIMYGLAVATTFFAVWNPIT